MKKFLIILLALIIGVGGGYFAYKKYGGRILHRKVTAENYKEPFMWGVNVNPSALRKYHISMWNQNMNYVSELGADWVRLGFDNEPTDKFKIFDEMINAANTKNINIYLGLGSSKPIETIDDTYQDGYQVADAISNHYKGKIKYYQLMSEQGSGASKENVSGEKENDYDPVKYAKVREWMKGASAAIRKNDSNAYIVITDQWLHTAYFTLLIKDKVDFDIIGWDWFGDMGLMADKKLEDGTLLIDKIKSFDKPIILAEVNDRPDTKKGMNEQKQAEFIQQMADWAYKSGYIKGFFVHELTDIRPTADKPLGDFYGIIGIQKAPDGGYTFGDKQAAFDIYKNIIAKYSK